MASNVNPYKPHLYADVLADDKNLAKYGVTRADIAYPGPQEMPPWLLNEYKQLREKHNANLRKWLLGLELPADVMQDAVEVIPTVLDLVCHNNASHVKMQDGIFTLQKHPTSSFADCLAEKDQNGNNLYTILHAQEFLQDER